MSLEGSAVALKQVEDIGRHTTAAQEEEEEHASTVMKSKSVSSAGSVEVEALEHLHDDDESLSCSTIDRFLEQQGFAVDDISSVSDDLSDKISSLRQQVETLTQRPARGSISDLPSEEPKAAAVTAGGDARTTPTSAFVESSALSTTSENRLKDEATDADSLDRSMLLGESRGDDKSSMPAPIQIQKDTSTPVSVSALARAEATDAGAGGTASGTSATRFGGASSVNEVLQQAEAALATISMQSLVRQSTPRSVKEDKELSDALGVRRYDGTRGSTQGEPRPRQLQSPNHLSRHSDDLDRPRSRRTPTKIRSSAGHHRESIALQEEVEEEKDDRQRSGRRSPSETSESVDLSSVISETIERSSEWRPLNKLLARNGYSPLTLKVVSMDSVDDSRVLVPDATQLFNMMADFIAQLDRKEHIIQDLVLDSTRSSKVQSRTEDNLLSSEKKAQSTKTMLLKANQEINRLKEEMRRRSEENEVQMKKLKKAMLHLKQQLKVSEHRVKAKEVLVERMQQKLQQQVDKENVSKQRDRQVFQQLKQKEWRNLKQKPSFCRPRRDDLKPLECISMYEAQQERMEEELAQMKAQVHALNAEIRDKENYIARKEFGANWIDPTAESHQDQDESRRAGVYGGSDELVEHLESVRREQEANALRLKQRESAMIKKVNAIEQELLHAREVIHELKEENANLLLEAESRPSIRDYRLAQRRIHQLEVQVSESKMALEDAKDINELRKYMDTKELMMQDRLNHRLRLNRLDTIPRETALEVIKGVCRELNLTDVTLITPSIQKLCAVVNAVPRMEKFIRDICGFVFFNRFNDNPTDEETKTNNQLDVVVLEQVLPTLEKWLHDLKRLHALEDFRVCVITELCKRTVEPNLLSVPQATDSLKDAKDPNLSRVVCSIAELVELEKNVMHQREIYKLAAAQMEREPNALINQIVRHFSQLFLVKSIEGVLPKINEIYLFVNEMQNFMKVLCETLNLPKTTSVSNLLTTLRDRLQPSDEVLRDRARSTALGFDSTNYVVDKAASRPQDDLVGIREVREMTLLVRDLKRELGAATMQDILPRTKRLMELLSLSIRPEDDEA